MFLLPLGTQERSVMPRQVSRLRQVIAAILAILFFASSGFVSAQETETEEKVAVERPTTPNLLPENTVVYFEIGDVRDLISKVNESAMGKMIQDEEIAPLFQELWQTGLDAYEEFVDIGLSIEQIQSIPAGQITIAVIAPKRKKPDFLMMIEMDPENEAVKRVLELGRERAEEEGASIETTDTDDVTYNTITNGDDTVTFFNIDSMWVVSNSTEQLDQFLDRWNGREVEKIRPLAENRKYITIMNRCRGTKDIPADVKFYVDPIELARSAFRGEFQAQFVINFLPLLGLDGVLALGGAASMSEEEFESVFHGHVLLSNPRKGIIEMLAFKPGDYQPEPFVPEDTVSYMSTSLDLRKLMVELERIVDLTQEEGVFRKGLESFKEEVGIDLELDIINSLEGRASLFTWMEPPARFNSQTFTVAIELADVEQGREVITKLMDRGREEDEDFDENIEEVDYNGMSYWRISDGSIERRKERRLERRNRRRVERGEDPIENQVELDLSNDNPQVSWGILENHFVLTFSPKCYEVMIDTYRGDRGSLADEAAFKSTAKKITRLLRSDMPCMMAYSQPKESMRMIFESARLENTEKYFDLAPENEWVQRIRNVMEDNPIPDFEKFEKYFNPAGMFVTNDDTGYHMLSFQTRYVEDGEESDED